MNESLLATCNRFCFSFVHRILTFNLSDHYLNFFSLLSKNRPEKKKMQIVIVCQYHFGYWLFVLYRSDWVVHISRIFCIDFWSHSGISPSVNGCVCEMKLTSMYFRNELCSHKNWIHKKRQHTQRLQLAK